MGAVVELENSNGGVVDRSLPILGVDAAEGVLDLEFLRASSVPLLSRGSAECWRLS